jgi:hypothetical protein
MKFTKTIESKKSAFPGKHFGDHLFDLMVFSAADKLVKGYNGGNWHYMTTENIAFMKLDGQQTLCNPFSYEEIEADENLSGMIVTCYAMEAAINRGQHNLIEAYGKLKDVIFDYCVETKCTAVWYTIMD